MTSLLPHLLRVALVWLSVLPASTSFAMSHLIYLGTYTRSPSTSEGIYSVRLDDETGALTAPVLAAKAVNPAWIAFSPDRKFLYTLHPSTAQAIGFRVDAEAGKLIPLPDPAAPEAAPPSHLAVDATGRVLFTANYADGYVASMAIRSDGTLAPPSIIRHSGRSVHPTRQEKPHVHSVTVSPDNRFVIVCDLGIDKVFSYAIDTANARLSPANPPFVATEPGAGPRHFKFGPPLPRPRPGTGTPDAGGQRLAYAINELNNTVTAYRYDQTRGSLTALYSAPTLPADFTGQSTTAEVRIHPNGRFLYASNRGHDSIAVFRIEIDPNAVDAATQTRLERVEIVPSGGRVPRNFELSPNGRWLVCGHQNSNNLTVFRVDPDTGRLQQTPHTVQVPAAVCLLFHD